MTDGLVEASLPVCPWQKNETAPFPTLSLLYKLGVYGVTCWAPGFRPRSDDVRRRHVRNLASSCPSCLRGEKLRRQPGTAYCPGERHWVGPRRTAAPRFSTTNTRRARRRGWRTSAASGHGPHANGSRPRPTNNAIRAINVTAQVGPANEVCGRVGTENARSMALSVPTDLIRSAYLGTPAGYLGSYL